MKESVFRKKSIERISSPEQINDYIRVANPSMWLIISAIILLLIARITWSIVGRIETTISVPGNAEDGVVTATINKDYMDKIAIGDKANVGNNTGSIISVSADEEDCKISVDVSGVPDGKVDVDLAVESIAPISFLLDKV